MIFPVDRATASCLIGPGLAEVWRTTASAAATWGAAARGGAKLGCD
ncbi:MAG TPA: hypothetical protein VGS07_21980 [Thermoanaerobaculia bacterium]|nr:hypothetical protein [Thermoanaerobaculia bacterium]